ncbi:MAG: peptidoglycan DD-metalloendopeptidase family protein [Halioglobus sp.]
MLKIVCYSVLLCLVVGCGGNPPAPIEDRHAKKGQSYSTRFYTVQKGETLYSIAFRYGLDYRVVAAANGIAVPYTIYPGQKIDLHKTKPVVLAAKPVAPASKPAAAPTPPASSSAGKAVVSKPAPPKTTASKPPTTSPSPAAPAKKPTTSSAGWSGVPVKSWRWPSTGRVTRGYSSTVHKGIDISGNRGDAVVAVASGKVVYAGTGIVGFGELLIVKHNEVYLSAYGHNDRLLVAEGQTVSAGQKIATKGSSGTNTVKLHFEIRKEGKPIDPKKLLPRR